MGLVKQVVSALTTRKIMQLTYTYITLSLKGEGEKLLLCLLLRRAGLEPFDIHWEVRDFKTQGSTASSRVYVCTNSQLLCGGDPTMLRSPFRLS